MFKLIIFDIDGTIVDAYTAIEKSLNYARRKLGYHAVSIRKVRASVGHGDRMFIETHFPEKDVEAALKLYHEHHEKALLRYSKVIPGARRLLLDLKKQGRKLAIASNRQPKFSRILLKHLDLLKYFDAMEFARNKNEIKPKPLLIRRVLKKLGVKKREALYLGDMAVDVDAGRNAGVKVVAVLGGSSSHSELKKAGPCDIIKKLSTLLHVAKKCRRKQ